MLDLIIDGQFGSTGKGKLAYFLLKEAMKAENPYDCSVCDFGPNAGHTVITETGEKHVFRQLPVAAMFPDVTLVIGPGAIIDKVLLFKEIEKYDCHDRLLIHPMVPVVREYHKEREQREVKRIASTMSGTGAAYCDKIMRLPHASVARHHADLSRFVTNWCSKGWHNLLAGKILGESAQGHFLSLDYGFYPYTTHRNVTVPAVLDRMGVHPDFLNEIWMTARTYPIRVGNVVDEKDSQLAGFSGPVFEDQVEVTWDQVGVTEERTTCTNRVRRVFTWSDEMFCSALRTLRPNNVFFNFTNYLRTDPAKWIASRVDTATERNLWRHFPRMRVLAGDGPGLRDMEEYDCSTETLERVAV